MNRSTQVILTSLSQWIVFQALINGSVKPTVTGKKTVTFYPEGCCLKCLMHAKKRLECIARYTLATSQCNMGTKSAAVRLYPQGE